MLDKCASSIFSNHRNLRLGTQRMNGSPVNIGGQVQTGL